MKLTETIYPKGMETHTNEIICIDHVSGKTFKELCPELYEMGYAFVGIFVCDENIYFIDDDEAEKYILKKYRLKSMKSSYNKGYHYYSEWEREVA
jgi:hypothetical protein